MKRLNIIVDVDLENGSAARKAELVGYDRDKYYIVRYLDDSSIGRLKGYWLKGLNKLKGGQRYLLNPDEVRLSNKELWKDYKFHKKLYCISTKARTYTIRYNNKSFFDLTLQQLKRKIRTCFNLKIDFHISVSCYYKSGMSMSPLIDYKGSVCELYSHQRDNSLLKLERIVVREIVKHRRA